MRQRLTKAQHDDYAYRAWQMSVRGLSSPQIARSLQVSEKTIDRMLKEQGEHVAAVSEEQRVTWRVLFEAEQDAVIAESWQNAHDKSASIPAKANHISNAMRASENKAKARGLFVNHLEVSGSINHDHHIDLGQASDEQLNLLETILTDLAGGASGEGAASSP